MCKCVNVCVCELVLLERTRHFLPGLECSLHQPGLVKTRTLPAAKPTKKQKNKIAADTAEKDSYLAGRKENNPNVVASLDARTWNQVSKSQIANICDKDWQRTAKQSDWVGSTVSNAGHPWLSIHCLSVASEQSNKSC